MGAGPGRLIRQLLTESVLLSVTGAALGVLAAYWGVKALSTMMPYYSFPHEAAIHVNLIVLVFSAAIALCPSPIPCNTPAPMAYCFFRVRHHAVANAAPATTSRKAMTQKPSKSQSNTVISKTHYHAPAPEGGGGRFFGKRLRLAAAR